MWSRGPASVTRTEPIRFIVNASAILERTKNSVSVRVRFEEWQKLQPVKQSSFLPVTHDLICLLPDELFNIQALLGQ